MLESSHKGIDNLPLNKGKTLKYIYTHRGDNETQVKHIREGQTIRMAGNLTGHGETHQQTFKIKQETEHRHSNPDSFLFTEMNTNVYEKDVAVPNYDF